MKRLILFALLLSSCYEQERIFNNVVSNPECFPKTGLYAIHYEVLNGNCPRIEDQKIQLTNSYSHLICDGDFVLSDNGCDTVFDDVKCESDYILNGFLSIESGSIKWNYGGEYAEAIERIEFYKIDENTFDEYFCAANYKLRYYLK